MPRRFQGLAVSSTPRLSRRSRPAFDTLECRQMLSASVKTTAVTKAVARPVINLLQTASKALKSVALAADFTAISDFTMPSGNVVNTIQPVRYSPLKLTMASIEKDLAAAPVLGKSATGLTIAIPAPNGKLQRFNIFQSSVMDPVLAAQTASFVKTFTGVGIDDPTQNISLDYTSLGFHASVLGPNGNWYVDPYWHRDTTQYASYFKSDLVKANSSWVCDTDDLDTDIHADAAEVGSPLDSGIINPMLVTGTQLRTYRLALATTGEYTVYQGGVTAAMSAVVSTVVRLNQVYERDLGVHLNLVGNESAIIYASAATDPFTSVSDPDATNTQLESTLDSVIGTANYDLGHVLHKASAGNDNGLAGGIGTVGTAGIKGEGYSAAVAPTVDPFTIDYVAHEIGHQFGGRHNFSSAGGSLGDSASLAVEPGSGTTIMSYAGIGSANENVQAHSDAMFNSINYEQIETYITGATHGAVITTTGNSAPSVSVVGSMTYSIPVSTPFALTAAGADADSGDVLTYSWEQRNGAGSVFATPTSTKTTGPAFRPYLPTTSPTRVFPILSTILAGGTSNIGETLPSVARSMSFTVMVRDNHTGGGGAATLSTLVTVSTVASGGAFAITNLNSATTLAGGSTQTLTWNVVGTTAAPFNVANVNILLSTDGGQTFPTTLAANTANDGTQDIQLPYGVGTSQARIKIVPTNSIFFDINNANLTITNVAVPVSATPGAPALSAASDTGVSNSDRITKLNNASGASALSFTVGNTVAGALVELLADGTVIGTASATGTSTTVTTNGTTPLTDGSHTFTVRQTESGKPVSTASASTSITIDTAAPAAPSAPDLLASSDSGVSSTDNITNNTNPSFSVASSDTYYQLTVDGSPVAGDYATGTSYQTTFTDGGHDLSLRSVDAAGNVSVASPTLHVVIDTVAPPTPGAPDLLASSDAGVSDSDDITNNASPTFGVASTDSYFQLSVDGTSVAGNYASGTTYQTSLADGGHDLALTSVDAAGNVSTASSALHVVIDTVAPTLTAPGTFQFETAQTLSYTFSEDLAGTLSADDLVITSANATVPAYSVALDPVTNQATVTFASLLPDGDYTASFNPPAGTVTDVAGNSLIANDQLNFFALAGDANRDRVVNFSDLVVVAQNYNSTGKTFSQGNFNYSANGAVDFGDLVILAQNYNKSLSMPAVSATSSAKAKGTSRVAAGVLA